MQKKLLLMLTYRIISKVPEKPTTDDRKKEVYRRSFNRFINVVPIGKVVRLRGYSGTAVVKEHLPPEKVMWHHWKPHWVVVEKDGKEFVIHPKQINWKHVHIPD